MAFACGTLPDILLSLQLPAGRQSALFLPRLGSLSLAVPSAAELRLCCHTPADATQAAYYGPGEPYLKWVVVSLPMLPHCPAVGGALLFFCCCCFFFFTSYG